MLFTNREDIKWINGDNSGIKIGSSVRLTFIQINSFLYNNEEKFYEFEIKIDENGIKNEFEVIDICIGENNTYAYCQVKDMLMKCKTKTLEYSDKDIYLLVNKNFGSVEWKNLEKNIKINNLISVDFLQAYNLNFNNGKWKFLIKYNNIVNFEGKKLLDILISGKNAFANCEINNYLLNCEVVSDNQDNTQLIELNKCYEGNLQLINIKYTFIPFNINLKLIRSYNLFFDNDKRKWSFEIEASLIDINAVIPKNSTFTLDILRLDNNKNELAFCSRINETELNIINLLCYTMEEMDNENLISLNNIKSDY